MGQDVPVIYESWIERKDLQENPDYLYLFGDNDQRRGLGGQAAAMRNEGNALGIRTKKAPSRAPGAFWSDSNYDENIGKITLDLSLAVAYLKQGGTVVIPEDGIGTGLSEMMEYCPRTFGFLNEAVAELATVSSE